MVWGQSERGEPLTHHPWFSPQTSMVTEETLGSLLWMLSLLLCYSRLSKQMLPGLRGRKRKKTAGGECVSQVNMMVGGGVDKYIYVRYQNLPEGNYSRGDLRSATITGCDFVAVRVLLLTQ